MFKSIDVPRNVSAPFAILFERQCGNSLKRTKPLRRNSVINFSSRLTCKSVLRLIATVAFALSLTNVAVAQDQEAEGICFSGKTAVVRGFIGGETHPQARYTLRVTKE